MSDVASQIETVASSTSEQATGIEEITVAAGQLDTATQENAAMFEETSASIEHLTSEFRNLMTAVGRFKLAGTQERAVPEASCSEGEWVEDRDGTWG